MVYFSFIIPVKVINSYIRESMAKILQIARDDYEIIIYPNIANDEEWPKTRQIASGPGGPAMKRSLALHDAQGEVLVFIDDDAYPEKNFLDVLDQDFRDEQVAAVGGPAITPADDTFWQRVSGAVFLSSFSGGYPQRYVPVGEKRYVDDWPSVNLSIRKSVFAQLGGFDCSYWPGEDTKLCLDIVNKLNLKILYNPELIVYHHRREGLLRHLKQIGGYGIHRGFFARKFPQTSFKFKYFLPSAFFLFVVLGLVASFFSPLLFRIYLSGWLIYFLALVKAFIDIKKYEKNILIVINALYYIFFTHLVYGVRFLQGFVWTRELRSKYR